MLERTFVQSGPDQLSYVTNDFERAMDTLRSALGVGPFTTMTGLKLANQKFAAGHDEMLIDAAIAWSGTQFLEIICPHSDDPIYGDAFRSEKFVLAFHHVAFAVHDWELCLRELAREGKQLAFSGEVEGMVTSGYWDARSTIGCFVEFYCNTPAGEAAWEQIRQGTFGMPPA